MLQAILALFCAYAIGKYTRDGWAFTILIACSVMNVLVGMNSLNSALNLSIPTYLGLIVPFMGYYHRLKNLEKMK